MKLTVLDNPQHVAKTSATYLLDVMEKKPNGLCILASGGTPTLTYDLVADEIQKRHLPLSQFKVHKLDEWLGLDEKDPQSCEFYLKKHVVNAWGIAPEHYTGVNATAIDLEKECERNRQYLKQTGGADICVLGLGLNGHVGFNEPQTNLPAFTSIVNLAESSKHHPMIAGKHQLTQGVTTGMVEIMASKSILLQVTGKHKRAILSEILQGHISTQLPASLLTLHPNLEIIADIEAASELSPSILKRYC